MNTDVPDDRAIDAIGNGELAIVIRKNHGRYHVQTRGREIPCALSSRLRKTFSYTTSDRGGKPAVVQGVKEIRGADPVAVGDEVRLVDAGDGTGMIVEVLPRRTRLSRTAPGRGAFEQVLVANANQVVPVFAAAQPAPKWGLLDRYLVAAEAAGLAAIVCITKTDLARPGDGLDRATAGYRGIGYPVLTVSAVTGEGLEPVREALRGRVSVLAGKSGVGKTSLLNALQPGLGLRVAAVGRNSKGRHTTTNPEMFPLDDGGFVVDTPGVREFGLLGIPEEDLAMHFPEMRALVGTCRFRLDCRHDEEPGCAVRRAVMDGAISPGRYRSYRRLAEDLR